MYLTSIKGTVSVNSNEKIFLSAERHDNKESDETFSLMLNTILVKCLSGGNNAEEKIWQKKMSNGI